MTAEDPAAVHRRALQLVDETMAGASVQFPGRRANE
jgi:hypothetical protein